MKQLIFTAVAAEFLLTVALPVRADGLNEYNQTNLVSDLPAVAAFQATSVAELSRRAARMSLKMAAAAFA